MEAVAEPENSTKDTPKESTTEKKLSADAFQHFIQGKRHMLVQDYTNAVASLAEACELYVEHFGQIAPECGEVYFHYGKALFRHFQQQSGIIGTLGSDESSSEDKENSDSDENKENENTDNGSNEGEDNENEEEEEEEEDEEDIGEEDQENQEASEDKKAEPETLKPEKPDSSLDKESGDAEASNNEEKKDGVPENSIDPELDKPGPSKPKEEEDEINDLQLAWETLETAKTIFSRDGDGSRESQLKVSEVLLITAEISMESENCPAALLDLQECLKIRRHLLEPDDRLIAETFYQLGLCYSLLNDVEHATEHFERSIDAIQYRINKLKEQTEIQKTPEGFDINPADEIAELEAILPDIKGKIEDVQGSSIDPKQLLMEMDKDEAAKPGNSSSDKPVTNITHLLKRKKPDAQENGNQVEVKRVKLTPVSAVDDQQPEVSSTTDVPNS